MVPIKRNHGDSLLLLMAGRFFGNSKEGVTGLFFYEQTVESIIGAVERFEKLKSIVDPKIIRNHARLFRKNVLRGKKEFVELKYNEFNHLVK